MDALGPSPEWVIAQSDDPAYQDQRLVESAKRLWPSVHAYAKRQDSGRISSDDKEQLVVEVWEAVLCSVARTRARLRLQSQEASISELDAYLFGAFKHRFSRRLRHEARRHLFFEPLAHYLDVLSNCLTRKRHHPIERDLQLQQIVDRMDEWTREVWTRRQYGYSWREIADEHGMSPGQAKMKFRYAIDKIRRAVSRIPENNRGADSITNTGGPS